MSSGTEAAPVPAVPPPPPPLVLIVDDDPAVCASLRRLLRAEGVESQAFPSTARLCEYGRPDRPCCLVLDVNLPDVGGLEFADTLRRAGVRLPVVFITGIGTVPMSVRAMKAGALDFLPKPFEAADLLRAVRRALAVDAELLARERSATRVRRLYRTLTDREREVFAGVTTGLLNKQVGGQLGVAEKTVKAHRARVMEKMGAGSLAALVRMADELGIHRPPSAASAAAAAAAAEHADSAGPDARAGEPGARSRNVDLPFVMPPADLPPENARTDRY